MLATLTLAAAMVLPAHAAAGVANEDPAPASNSTTGSTAPGAGASTGPVVQAADGAWEVPGIATEGWVLADLDTGEILAMQDPDKLLRPASTLKLLTALTVAPRLAPEQPYRAVKADETAEGSRVVLYNGLEYTVADLLHATLLPSANDAAEALARANGGIADTVTQMNAEADRIGAVNTTAVNPSGLDAEGQFTTARDIAAIGRAAFANPEIVSYLQLRAVDFPGKRAGSDRVIYPIYNANRMLRDNFEGALGGKSGYTSQARRTMVAAAERDGRRLIASLLNIGGNTYTTAEVLLDWGFANADKLTPVGQLPEPSEAAPTFERAVVPLPERGQAPAAPAAPEAQQAGDAPTAPAKSRSLALPSFSLPGLPSPLTVLTLLMAVLVVLRARVYWISHRSRTAWTSLDTWAASQAQSSRRRGPSDRRVRTGRSHSAAEVEDLIGTFQPLTPGSTATVQ